MIEDGTNAELKVLEFRTGAVVVLEGEHDLSNKDHLHATLSTLLQTHPLVVVDLSNVLFVDSSILGTLVWADRHARETGKRFRLQLGTEPIVKRILEISGLLTVFDSYRTRDEALDGTTTKQPDNLL